MKKLSIGIRLTLWYVAIFAAAQLVFGLGMWLILRQNLYSITDEALRDQIDDLTHFLQAQRKNATVAKLQEEVAEAYILEHSGDYLQIYSETGEWIYRAPALARFGVLPLDPQRAGSAEVHDFEAHGHAFRLLTQRLEVHDRLYTVQTAVPIDGVLRTLSRFRGYLLLFAPALLAAAALGGYWLSCKALSPVGRITRAARNISAGNLSDRLDTVNSGDELQQLSETLNQMLARIEEAFLRVTEFTADASHELRTPVSLIRAEAEIALRKLRPDQDYREALRQILIESEKTTTLLDQLLTLARADSGREHLHMIDIDLRNALQAAESAWRPLIESRDLHFKVRMPDHSVMVVGDSSAIDRLIRILLDNAVKYTPAPGQIDLQLDENGQEGILTVRDTGIGIPDEHRNRIFERFYRVDKMRSRNLGGNGIGLSIAHWIVRQHNGTIVVRSKLDQGSSFIVGFPLTSVDPESVSPTSVQVVEP